MSEAPKDCARIRSTGYHSVRTYVDFGQESFKSSVDVGCVFR